MMDGVESRPLAARWLWTTGVCPDLWPDRIAAALGIAMVVVTAVGSMAPVAEMASLTDAGAKQAASPPSGRTRAGSRPEWAFGGYGGIADTLGSTVHIKNPGKTDLKVRDFDWIGRPFKAPIYYGLRAQRWSSAAPVGGMIDFTHAKAIAKRDSVGTFEGTIDGKPAAPKAKMGDFFKHLEFSHGHNMVTLNGLLRLAPWWWRVRPYVGLGAGVSLPHSEVGIRSQNKRTYQYEFAGFVGQALAGVQIQLGRTAVFVEYKFTYAPYDIPLTEEPYGWLLVTDLWGQFKGWWDGKAPPGGRLTTTLITHHAIAGVLVKNRTYMDAVTR